MEFSIDTLIGGARGIFQRPRIATGLYTLAVIGVLATMDRRPAAPGVVEEEEPLPGAGAPERHILE